MNSALLTVEQAASQLGVSKSIVYALVEGGKLACHRIGLGRGTIRFSQADIDSYLKSCRHGKFVKESVPRRTTLKHIRL